ncbi:unnamed protein product [Clonostachys rosea]|uniref:Uncharacterized protein n=1 Tax=Bionectria ochroleuca TaxID=29856 RepID=A0ABY6TRM2_BIOOC|nr:unnamed protein product [Clonostachys rosea]
MDRKFAPRRGNTFWSRAKYFLPILEYDTRRRLYQRLYRRRGIRILVRNWRLILGLAILLTVETWIHVRNLTVVHPTDNLDPPFYETCQSPIKNTHERANATLVMMARNSDVKGAVASILNVQERFNDNFGYPWVFLNNEEWSEDFIDQVTEAVHLSDSGATARFELIPSNMWGYPSWVDKSKSQHNMQQLEEKGIMYAGKENYHHMCRFSSGVVPNSFFYDIPALQEYKWYWRVEPDISFTCDITYDPFYEMEKTDKKYGWVVALWEIETTVPTLFRKISEYKKLARLPTTPQWKSMLIPTRVPWPFRSLFYSNKPGYDVNGDQWNFCHFWSNFEIADMDFYRSDEYRNLFHYLDDDGGFYYERWGDAPIHSLAAALLLRPDQIHHFSDWGYIHGDFQWCPYGPTIDNMKMFQVATDLDGKKLADIRTGPDGDLGCNCKCNPDISEIAARCYNSWRSSVA